VHSVKCVGGMCSVRCVCCVCEVCYVRRSGVLVWCVCVVRKAGSMWGIAMIATYVMESCSLCNLIIQPIRSLHSAPRQEVALLITCS